MGEQKEQNELQGQTERLLQGPLKHARAAALSLALVPLAAVGAGTTASDFCPSGGICGVVFYDTNNNGVQDPDEPGIPNAVVTINGDDPRPTDETGVYYFPVPPGTYEIAVQIPPGTQPSPGDSGNDDTKDSDGVPDGVGNSVATTTLEDGESQDPHTDFGFWQPPVAQPGTGTPGYWKNHPDAWPVQGITVGGLTYSKEQAIAILNQSGKDRTLTMFSSLVPAMLNVVLGNDSSCVATTIASANEWMATYGPVGSSVHAASVAWKRGEPMHRQLDNYNNGMLCAPHRD